MLYGTDELLAVILSKEGCGFFRLSQQFCSWFLVVWLEGVILEKEFILCAAINIKTVSLYLVSQIQYTLSDTCLLHRKTLMVMR